MMAVSTKVMFSRSTMPQMDHSRRLNCDIGERESAHILQFPSEHDLLFPSNELESFLSCSLRQVCPPQTAHCSSVNLTSSNQDDSSPCRPSIALPHQTLADDEGQPGRPSQTIILFDMYGSLLDDPPTHHEHMLSQPLVGPCHSRVLP